MRFLSLLSGCLAGWFALSGALSAQGYGEEPAAGFIEITQGSYSRIETLRIYADDRLERRLGHPVNATSISDGATGLYNRLAHFLAREGPAVAERLADAPICPDWGEITIRAEPAVAGISRIRAGCPDSAIEPLRDQILVIVGR